MQTHKLLKSVFFIFTFILFVFLLPKAWASAANLYQVEVIVFAYQKPNLSAESWPQILITPTTLKNSVTYPLLPESAFTMQREAARLAKNKNYKILLHAAWQQPISQTNSLYARPIRIFGGKNYNLAGNTIWQIDGTLTLTKNNYFSVKTNLIFTEPKSAVHGIRTYVAAAQNSFANSANLISFPLTKTQRMQSNQVNYIDHPLFGILIKITPN